VVSAFKEDIAIIWSRCSKICQVIYRYRQKKMHSIQPSQQTQLLTQADAFPFLQEFNENWTKVSYKHSRSPNSNAVTKAKYSKESEYWLNQPAISNLFELLQ
jgi:hypothetical protein